MAHPIPLLIVLLCGLICGLVIAEETFFYVNPTSTTTIDSNCGTTAAAACQNIASALEAASLSTSLNPIIVLAAGNYTGSANNDLCYKNPCPSNFTITGPPVSENKSPAAAIQAHKSDVRGLVLDLGNQTAKLWFIAFQNFYIPSDFDLIEIDGIDKKFTNGGAAIMATDAYLIELKSCSFTNNSAVAGGAVAAVNSPVTMVNTKFTRNKAGLFGGAVLVYQASLYVNSSSFTANAGADYFKSSSNMKSLDGSGGAIYATVLNDTPISIQHSHFINNTAGSSGGAVYIGQTSETNANLNIFIQFSEFEKNSLHGSGICLTSSTCDSNGGAVFISANLFMITDCNFTSNTVESSAPNVFSQGGAIYSTSRYSIQEVNGAVERCRFTSNFAESYGGALYNINQHLHVIACHFTTNVVGSASSLFADSSAAGGAIWYSAQDQDNIIKESEFLGNTAFGGWGGGIFCTNCKRIVITRNSFFDNKVFSSYTFQAQGGAIMISFESIANITNCDFNNNTATPIMTSMPYTFSGSGGAVFVESATVDMADNEFVLNKALTGQFDDGAEGGAVLFENVNAGTIRNCLFYFNSAEGIFQYSSFASSGNGGAISLKFSSVSIEHGRFEGNWVSVGGTQMAIGGAMSVFFNYVEEIDSSADTTTSSASDKQPVSIYNVTFISNVAYTQLCRSASTKSGQGGAIALIGANSPGVFITNSSFEYNLAVSSRTGIVPSVGGGVAMTMSSFLNCSSCSFKNNLALYGIGNDISSVTGFQSANDTANALVGDYCAFTAADAELVKKTADFAKNNATTLCEVSMEYKDQLNGVVGTAGVVSSSAYVNGRRLTAEDELMSGLDTNLLTKAYNGDNRDEVAAARLLLDEWISQHSHEEQGESKQQEFEHERATADSAWPRVHHRRLTAQQQKGKSAKQKRLQLMSKLSSDLSAKHDSLSATAVMQDGWKVLNEYADVHAHPDAFTSKHDNHKNSMRALRTSKTGFAKSEFSAVPGVVIAAGTTELLSPTFVGDYHIFVGDFVYVKNIYATDEFVDSNAENGISTTSTEIISALTQQFVQTKLTIGGDVTQEALSLTILKATAQVSRYGEHTIAIKEIKMWNATLETVNDLIVTGNCSFIDSYITGLGHSAATVHFNSSVRTGLGFQRSQKPLLDRIDDDSIKKNSQDIIDILAATPLLVIDNIVLRVHKLLRLTSDWTNAITVDNRIYIQLTHAACIVIESGAVLEINAKTIIKTDSDRRSHFSLNNSGIIQLRPLDPASNDIMLLRMEGTNFDSLTYSPNPLSSGLAPLTVFGKLYQAETGIFSVTLLNQYYNVSMMTLEDGGTIKGAIHANLGENTTVQLTSTKAGTVATNWSLATSGGYGGSTSIYPLEWEARVITKPTGLNLSIVQQATHLAGSNEYLMASNLACNEIMSYYTGALPSNLCYLCSLNTSCGYCGGTSCITKGSETCPNGGAVWSDCCEPTGCVHGSCNAKDSATHTQYTCDCVNSLISGPTCAALSEGGIGLVLGISFVMTFVAVVVYYNRYYTGQKTEILEELRQNLLTPTALTNKSVSKKSNVTKQFLDDLQQSLILKDVFVNYDEIKVESRIGEGSFGVVFKATFRGAQVALKQMRSPLFQNISEHDIEEFRKEAYMMSRLRHPNIVLVMGISLVDIEPVGRQSSMHSLDQSNVPSQPVGGFGWARKTENASQNKSQKTVCIITEFLEQGSLSDILYGPTRLPEEVFTYELVLACALQAARGMLYLHSHQPPICHRDLKSSNLVVDDHWVVKVTDFGMSRIIPEKVQNHEMGLDAMGNTVAKEDRESYSSSNFEYNQYRESELGMPIPRDSSAHNVLGSNTSSSSLAPAAAPSAASQAAMANTLMVGRGTDLTDSQNIRISTANNSLFNAASQNNRYSSFHPEMTSNLGTTAWCAPELLTAASTTRYSVKVDVYSFGMVMWELWEKRRPYDEFHSRFDITDAIRSGKRPVISDNCPPAWKSLVQRCWQAEPARRPTFKYIEKYLKDELARVRRQKHGSGGGGGVGSVGSLSFSYGGSSSGHPLSGSNNTHHSHSNHHQHLATSIDSSSLLSAGHDIGGNRNDSNSSDGGGAGQESGRLTRGDRGSIPIPITNPIHAPEGRSPLVAFERSFSYLAKSLETSSSPTLSTDSFGQSPGVLPSQQQQRQPINANVAVRPTTAAVGGAGAGAAGKGWRDRYVLKFSGWQQSNPDAGLPPPSHQAATQQAQPQPPQGGLNANTNVGSNNKSVAMELRAHNLSKDSAYSSHARASNLDAIEEGTGGSPRESTVGAVSARESEMSVFNRGSLAAVSGLSVGAVEAALAGRSNATPPAATVTSNTVRPLPPRGPGASGAGAGAGAGTSGGGVGGGGVAAQESQDAMFAMDDDHTAAPHQQSQSAAPTESVTDMGEDDEVDESKGQQGEEHEHEQEPDRQTDGSDLFGVRPSRVGPWHK